MKKNLKLIVLALFAGTIVVSCSKSTDEPTQEPSIVKNISTIDFLKTPEGNVEFAKALQRHMENHPQYKDSEFIVPFFTTDGFGVAQDLVLDCELPWLPPNVCLIVSGEIGFFNAEYGPKDWWRVNPDGTISVHLSSTDANGAYIDIGAGEFYTGDGCHLTMNYTGTWTEETIILPWGVEITISFIDLENSRNNVMYHGNGKVQLNGAGPKRNLVAHVSTTPGGQSNTYLNFN